MNAPRLSVIRPPVNRLTCCIATLLFRPKWGAGPPSCPAWVWVKVGCSMTAKGGARPIAAAQCVAAELEAAAERGQLEKGGMASRAWLAGLAGIEGERDGRPRRQTDEQYCGDGRGTEKNGKHKPAAADCDGSQQMVPTPNHASISPTLRRRRRQCTGPKLLTPTTPQCRVY